MVLVLLVNNTYHKAGSTQPYLAIAVKKNDGTAEHVGINKKFKLIEIKINFVSSIGSNIHGIRAYVGFLRYFLLSKYFETFKAAFPTHMEEY